MPAVCFPMPVAAVGDAAAAVGAAIATAAAATDAADAATDAADAAALATASAAPAAAVVILFYEGLPSWLWRGPGQSLQKAPASDPDVRRCHAREGAAHRRRPCANLCYLGRH